MITKNEEPFYFIPKYSNKVGDREIKTLIDLLDHVFPLFLNTLDNNIKKSEEANDLNSHDQPKLLQSITYCTLPKLSVTEGDTPRTINDDKNDSVPVTKSFLKELAYGIQSIKNFHPTRTLLMVSKRINHIKNAAHQKNHPVILATDYFFGQFKESPKWFLQLPKSVLEPNSDNIKPITFTSYFREILNSKKNLRPELINNFAKAIANDIYLLNSLSFLSLKLPVDFNHQLTFYFNRLIEFFTKDFKTVLNHYEYFQIRFQVYLKIACILLELNDYHGAGIINYVFQIIKGEIGNIANTNIQDKLLQLIKNEELIKLHRLFAPEKNYSILRETMSQNLGIPFFPVVCKDLQFTADGNKFSDQIEIFGKLYLDISKKKEAVYSSRKTMTLEFQTDLSYLINNELKMETLASPRTNKSIDSSLNETLASSQKTKKTFSKKEKRQRRYSTPVKIETSQIKETNSQDAIEPKRRTTIQTLSHTISRFFIESPRQDMETEDNKTAEDDTPKMTLTYAAEI